MSPKIKLYCAVVTFHTVCSASSLQLSYILCTCGTAGFALLVALVFSFGCFFGDVFLHRKHPLPVVFLQWRILGRMWSSCCNICPMNAKVLIKTLESPSMPREWLQGYYLQGVCVCAPQCVCVCVCVQETDSSSEQLDGLDDANWRNSERQRMCSDLVCVCL